jgi:hypothetical protein
VSKGEKMSRRLAIMTLTSLLIAAAATVCMTGPSAAKAPEASPEQAKDGSALVAPAGSPGAGSAPQHGPPLYELGDT